MNGLVLIVLAVASIVLLGILTKHIEPFVPEFLEQSNVKRTSQTKDSSYEQRTNHSIPQPQYSYPKDGMESPFRVNAFNAFVA